MSESFLDLLKNAFDLPDVDVRTYSPLALAFIGDSVFDTVIRSVAICRGNRSGQDLHHLTAEYVNAAAQAAMAEALLPCLAADERAIFQRGRNAKSANTAKNASDRDYRQATGFEALIGYLYLQGRQERILELVRMGIEAIL